MNRRRESWTRDAYFRAANNLCANIRKEICQQEDEFCSKNAVFEQKLGQDRQHFSHRLHRQHHDDHPGANEDNASVRAADLRCAVEESLFQADEDKQRAEQISILQRVLPLAFLHEETELELKCNLQRLLRSKLYAVGLSREVAAGDPLSATKQDSQEQERENAQDEEEERTVRKSKTMTTTTILAKEEGREVKKVVPLLHPERPLGPGAVWVPLSREACEPITPARRARSEGPGGALAASGLGTNRDVTEQAELSAAALPEGCLVNRRSSLTEDADGSEGTVVLPKWLPKLEATTSCTKLTLLALKFVQKAVESEALHERHFFAYQRSILHDKLTEIHIKRHGREKKAQLINDENKYRAVVGSSFHDRHTSPADELSINALVEGSHSETEAKTDLHDMQHQLRELVGEEEMCKKNLSNRLKLVDRLLNSDRYVHDACHAKGRIARRNTMKRVPCQEYGSTLIEENVLPDSFPRLELRKEEQSKELCDGVPPQQSGMDTKGQPTSSPCDAAVATAIVLDDGKSPRFAKESVDELNRTMLQSQGEGEYVIIQLDSEEFDKDDLFLSHSAGNPNFKCWNDVDERWQRLRWISRKVEHYMWPAELEQSIAHSLHGYVDPSIKFWRPIGAKIGATTLHYQQKGNAEITTGASATHTEANTSYENTLHSKSVSLGIGVGSRHASVHSRSLQTHGSERDRSLPNASFLVPKLPWRGMRAILSVRGAGDLMASEVTFSTFRDE